MLAQLPVAIGQVQERSIGEWPVSYAEKILSGCNLEMRAEGEGIW